MEIQLGSCQVFQTASLHRNTNLQKGIYETTEYLETFLRNLLLDEKNELHNRNLYISGLLNEEKVNIVDTKVDIENEKVDIEGVLSEKGSDFSVKTTVHIHRLFEKFGSQFGCTTVHNSCPIKNPFFLCNVVI